MASKWTVFYFTDDLKCTIKRALFGVNGCHQRNVDELRYGPLYIEMIDKQTNKCRFLDYGHVAFIDCNYGYEESCEEIKAEYMCQMKEKMEIESKKIVFPDINNPAQMAAMEDLYG
jgi:hypothetical protein